MNKTINVSLGKQFFYIDEEAYLALNNYLDAIKRYLINEEGRDEILADVEARIAELFTEKLQSEREVVQVNEVERVIGIMGKPSDYKVDQDDSNYADGNENDYKQYAGQTKNKKFFRDDEKNLLGGVCAGLAHNFGIDILWMRLLWVILLFLSFGTFILLYVVLWIVVPVARTTALYLAMMG
jgi:phage shock protein PspC (stress-responsive transcriptional regulator)